MDIFLYIFLLSAVGLFFLPLLIVPIFTRLGFHFRTGPKYTLRPLESETFPHTAIFSAITNELSAAGFIFVDDLFSDRMHNELWTARLFTDDSKKTLIELRHRTNSRGKIQILSILIFSRLDDGYWVLTSNDPLPSLHPAGLCRSTRLPSGATSSLIEHHRRVLNETAMSRGNRETTVIGDNGIDWLNRFHDEWIGRHVSEKRFVQTGESIQPTLWECYRRQFMLWRAITLRSPHDVPRSAIFEKDLRFDLKTHGQPLEGERGASGPGKLFFSIAIITVAIGLGPVFYGIDGLIFMIVMVPIMAIMNLVVDIIFRAVRGKLGKTTFGSSLRIYAWTLLMISLFQGFAGEAPGAGDMTLLTDPNSPECGRIIPCKTDCSAPERFERVSPQLLYGTSALSLPDKDVLQRPCVYNIGGFLSRIWALYGKPDSVDFEGFSYAFKDRQSGLLFSAYSAGSGPRYGGRPEQLDELTAVIRDFEALVAATRPADCEIVFDTDFGKIRAGARNGIPFEETVRPKETP